MSFQPMMSDHDGFSLLLFVTDIKFNPSRFLLIRGAVRRIQDAENLSFNHMNIRIIFPSYISLFVLKRHQHSIFPMT